MQELLIGLTLFGVVSTTLYFLIKLYFSTENENYRNLNNKCHSCMSLTIKEIEVSNNNKDISNRKNILSPNEMNIDISKIKHFTINNK